MTLYALRFAPGSDSIDDAETVAESRDGWAFLREAITLWRLVNPAHAHAIEQFVDHVADASDGPTRFAGNEAAGVRGHAGLREHSRDEAGCVMALTGNAINIGDRVRTRWLG